MMVIEITWAHVSGIIAAIIVPSVIGYLHRRDNSIKTREKIKTHTEEMKALKNQDIKQSEVCKSQMAYCDHRRAIIEEKIEKKVDIINFERLNTTLENTNQNVIKILTILAERNEK